MGGRSRRNKKQRVQSMQQMPREIVMDILSRLSWQDLLERVRFVCREWYLYIKHNDFTHLHMHRIPFHPSSFTYRLVFVQYVESLSAFLIVHLHIRGFHVRVYLCYKIGVTNKISVDHNFFGSMNGLISLHKVNTNTACVLNPLTKQMVTLPPSPSDDQDHGCSLSATGFGFCDVTKEYKLVHVYVVDALLHHRDDVIKVEMISMGVDSRWRKPKGKSVSPPLLPVGSGVVIGSVMYWLGHLVRPNIPNEVNWSKGIVWFDVSSEDFGVIGCPYVHVHVACYNQRLVDKDGEVCLVSHCIPGERRKQKDGLIELVMWTLKQPFTPPSKWVKQPSQYINCKQPLQHRLSTAVYVRQGVYVVTYTSNTNLFESRLVLLNGQAELIIFKFQKKCVVVPYRLSLVSPPATPTTN